MSLSLINIDTKFFKSCFVPKALTIVPTFSVRLTETESFGSTSPGFLNEPRPLKVFILFSFFAWSTDSPDVVLRLLCCFKLARIALHIRRFGDRFLPLAGVTRVRTLRIKSGLQSKPDLSLLHGDPDVTVTKVTEQGEIDWSLQGYSRKRKRFEGTRRAIAINNGRHFWFWKVPPILFTKVNPIQQLNWERPPRLILQPYLDNYSIFWLIKGA